MDQQIKERMVGAAVLVIAAVIFIPMLLSGSPQQGTVVAPGLGSESGRRPNAGSSQSAAGQGFSSRIVPLGAPAPAPEQEQEQEQNVAREQAARPAARETGSSPSPAKPAVTSPAGRTPSIASPAKPKPQTAAKAESVRKAIAAPSKVAAVEGWVVQLGSFSSSRNAHALRDRLKSKGYKAFARSSGSGAQAVTRVYVGPDASRERAQQLVSRLFTETRLKGIVIRNPGTVRP